MSDYYSAERILEFYHAQSHSRDLNHPQSVGWYNHDTQKMRFFILSQIADLSNKSILDVGCGPGGFYAYLKECFLDFKYTGVDLKTEFVEYARKQYPQVPWLQADFLEHDFKEQRFDFVCASGTMAIKVSDNQKFVESMIRKMFTLCKVGVAVNMLSDLLPEKPDEQDLNYYSPTQIFKFCQTLTPFVTLRHDYLLNDFTVYLFRE